MTTHIMKTIKVPKLTSKLKTPNVFISTLGEIHKVVNCLQ